MKLNTLKKLTKRQKYVQFYASRQKNLFYSMKCRKTSGNTPSCGKVHE